MKLYSAADLHSNNHFLTIIDEQDRRLLEKRLPNDLAVTLRTLEPYRAELVGVAVESTFNWYWLVDGLAEAGYSVKLVNTSKVRQYEGLKYADDRHDAFWLAQQMRLGILPTGYIYPKEQRAIRDLLRERRRLVRQRTTHVLTTQSTLWRHTAIRVPSKVILGEKEAPWPELPDRNVKLGVQAHRATIKVLTKQIETIEATLLKQVKTIPEYKILLTVPGIGPVIAWTIVLEAGDLSRFANVGHFASSVAAWTARGSVTRRRKARIIEKMAIHIWPGRSSRRRTLRSNICPRPRAFTRGRLHSVIQYSP